MINLNVFMLINYLFTIRHCWKACRLFLNRYYLSIVSILRVWSIMNLHRYLNWLVLWSKIIRKIIGSYTSFNILFAHIFEVISLWQVHLPLNFVLQMIKLWLSVKLYFFAFSKSHLPEILWKLFCSTSSWLGIDILLIRNAESTCLLHHIRLCVRSIRLWWLLILLSNK